MSRGWRAALAALATLAKDAFTRKRWRPGDQSPEPAPPKPRKRPRLNVHQRAGKRRRNQRRQGRRMAVQTLAFHQRAAEEHRQAMERKDPEALAGMLARVLRRLGLTPFNHPPTPMVGCRRVPPASPSSDNVSSKRRDRRQLQEGYYALHGRRLSGRQWKRLRRQIRREDREQERASINVGLPRAAA